MTFGESLKRYIRGGATAPQAMRRAWQDVRAGRVAPPRLKSRAALPVEGPRRLTRSQVHRMRRDANPTAQYDVTRVASPRQFDPRSFRTVIPRRGVRVTVGCPKGAYDPRRRRCRAGMRIQRIMRAKGNPLTRAETGEMLKAARVSLHQAKHPRSMAAPADPVQRAEHSAWWRGRGDALLAVAAALGTKGRRRLGQRRRGAAKLQRYTGPSGRHRNPVAEYSSPKLVRIYNRLEAIAARGHVDDLPSQGYQHTFRSGGPIFGVSKSGAVYLHAGDLVVRRRKAG